MLDRFARHHRTHVGTSARVADHARAAAHKYKRTVPCALHVRHSHKRDEVPYVQTVRRGVVTRVESYAFFAEQFVQFVLVDGLFDVAACFQHVKNVLHSSISPFFRCRLAPLLLGGQTLFLCVFFRRPAKQGKRFLTFDFACRQATGIITVRCFQTIFRRFCAVYCSTHRRMPRQLRRRSKTSDIPSNGRHRRTKQTVCRRRISLPR